jgi:hypothetical protein
MRFSCRANLVFGSVLLLVTAGFGQSLGEVAREQQQKKPATAAHTSKVITNEDLPENPETTSDSGKSQGNSYNPPASNDVRSAREWKAAILQQKNAIAAMQKNIDELKSSIHFVEANRYLKGVQYNQRQMQKQQEAEQMQKQVDQQKKRLEEMQEAARRAGLGNAVYDP